MKIFIVGAARSGTTLLQQLFATHTALAGINETAILKKIPSQVVVSTGMQTIARTVEELEIVTAYAKKEGVYNDVCTKYEFLDLYCRAFVGTSQRGYVEKTPVHALFVKELLTALPDARIIVVLRDPRAIITSRTYTKRISRGKRFHMPRLVQFFFNLTELMFTYRSLGTYLDHPHVRFVWYRDMLAQPESTLRRLFDFVGLPFEPVHLHIDPTDHRLSYKTRTHTMNSSFGAKEARTIDSSGLEQWKKHIRPWQDRLIRTIFTKEQYPVLDQQPSLDMTPTRIPRIVIWPLTVFSYIDKYLFYKKNVR